MATKTAKKKSSAIDRRTEVKKTITRQRLEIKAEKETVPNLGDPSQSIDPEDFLVMYLAKDLIDVMRHQVRASNRKAGLQKAYEGRVDPATLSQLDEFHAEHESRFNDYKKKITKLVEKHPLWKKFEHIRGFTPYQLGLIMGYIKDINRFEKPSGLMVYAGVGAINGMAVTKGNINAIKDLYFKQGKEFAGFNTEFAGRMYVIVDSLVIQRGFFYDNMQRERERLEKKAIAEGKVFDEDGELYMVGRKKQSLKIWSLANARRRIARNLLHMVWEEWRILRNLPTRDFYVFEYLGHDRKSKITADAVCKYDIGVTAKFKAERIANPKKKAA